MKKITRASLLAVLFVVFVDNFGLYVVFPLFTPLVIMHGQNGLLEGAFSLEIRMLYLSILIAAFPFAQFFGAPFFGHIGDRFGKKHAFLITLLGELIGYLLSFAAIIARSYTLLLISRVVTGFSAGNVPLCLAVVSDYTTNDTARRRLIGNVTAIIGITFVLAVGVGGFLSNTQIPIPFSAAALPFGIAAVLTAANIAVIIGAFREPVVEKGLSSTFGAFHLLSLKFIYLAFLFFALGWIASLQFLAAFLFETFRATHTVVAITFAIISISWLISNTVVNRLLMQIQRARENDTILRAGLALLPLFFALSLAMPSLELFILFFSLSALCSALVWTHMTSAISFAAPTQQRGRLLGLTQSMVTLASLLAPFIMGFLGQTNILYAYYAATACLLLAPALFYFHQHQKV